LHAGGPSGFVYSEVNVLERTRLGKTELAVSRSGFGVLPLQRVPMDGAVRILRAALDGGVTFYDTARGYTDSESKVGAAFEGARDKVIIATKSHAGGGESMTADLHTSLKELRTDYVDIYQFHNAKKCHEPGEKDGLYDAALKAKDDGKIRHIGITSHRIEVAVAAAKSGLYDTVQFPLSYLSSKSDIELVELCKANDVGFIAMKALSGGLITDASAAFAWMRRLDNVVPIWGIQRMSELDEFLALEKSPPSLDAAMIAKIERDRAELSGNFCRGCGYCQPCPAGIEITWIARMPLLLRRAVASSFVTDEWRAKMEVVRNCLHCDSCKSRCPYELDTPGLLEAAYVDYQKFVEDWDRPQAV
jgi:predicted aldo/keto reductase-like oxidoreductase